MFMKRQQSLSVLMLIIIILLSIFVGCASNEVETIQKQPLNTVDPAVPSPSCDPNISEVFAPKINVDKVLSAKIPIFMYHSISEKIFDTRYPENFFRPKILELDIKFLRDKKYDAIFISDFDNIGAFKRPVALTFDDGYKNFYKVAYPLLKKYKIKATLYVITGKVGEKGRCTWADLIEMEASGFVSVESHSVNHLAMSSLSNAMTKAELSESKAQIEKRLNKKVVSFCYPAGEFNSMTVELAGSYYAFALDKHGGVYDILEHDRYIIPRIRMSRNYGLKFFEEECKYGEVVLK